MMDALIFMAAIVLLGTGIVVLGNAIWDWGEAKGRKDYRASYCGDITDGRHVTRNPDNPIPMNFPFTVRFSDITWHRADEPPKEDLYGALVIPRGWEYAIMANYQAEDDADFKAGWYGSHRSFDFDVLEPIDAFAWANIDYNAILGWWAFYEVMGWPLDFAPRNGDMEWTT